MELGIAIKAAILSVLASFGISAGASANKTEDFVNKIIRKENHGAEVRVVAKSNGEAKTEARVKKYETPAPTVTPTPKPEYQNHGAQVKAVAKKQSLEVGIKLQ